MKKIIALILISVIKINQVEAEGRQDFTGGPFSVDINRLKNVAEVIVIAQLNTTQTIEYPDDENYQIQASQLLKGRLTENSLLIIENMCSDSWDGSPPTVDSKQKYLLFLKKYKKENKSNDRIWYSIVGNWKGIIAFDKTVDEKRAAQNIYSGYHVNIYENFPVFIEAIKFTASEKPPEKISAAAEKMIHELQLKR